MFEIKKTNNQKYPKIIRIRSKCVKVITIRLIPESEALPDPEDLSEALAGATINIVFKLKSATNTDTARQ